MSGMHKILALAVTLTCFWGTSWAQHLPLPPSPNPSPSLIGIWYLGSRACTSNAVPNDGLEIGTDTVQISYNPDLSFEEKLTVGGCESITKGTYALDDRKIVTTSAEVKTCKDENPVPVKEVKVTYLAYLDENESVTVTTGSEAAKVCPAEDALVKIFSKIILQ